jgi:hypothetical protein
MNSAVAMDGKFSLTYLSKKISYSLGGDSVG